VNKLILGDNLEILKGIDSETIDLIYLDPPFFSNRTYEVIWGDDGEIRSFQDRWSGGIDHYIGWLKERVEQMHRILKPTGSIFLHCDWHANAYIRVEILDRIFGASNFKNEIIWFYHRWTNTAGTFQKMHDTIFWYGKTKDAKTFNKNGFAPSSSQLKKFEKGWDQNVVYLKGEKVRQYIIYNREKFEKNCKNVDANARLVYRETTELKVAPPDVLEISVLNSQSDEFIGYPTQKPEDLLYKLIFTASNEGDLVLDPFLGGGTTIAVADKLNRKWIGIDQSVQAVKVTELRLDKQRDLFSSPFTVQLHKYDYDTLRYKNAFEFESWIVQQFGGLSNAKQRGDLGLDGRMPDNTPVQVKRSDNIGRNVIDNFKSAIERYDEKLFSRNVAEGKPAGYIIAFSFGRGAVEEVARLKLKSNIIIELVTVDKIVPIAKKPTLNIEITKSERTEKDLWEIEFTAVGTSEAGIEFYSWDFDYDSEKGFKADVMIDKTGQQTLKLKACLHNIAVKVVDNDGLESIEAIKIKVNGTVERAN
ncbi:MAG: site-specific DNA-methyltransferase, partial [Prevotellaceae bacterium]|nr:site-specific DNA-methyltransferase [Prevotellaceae bacterium]